MKLKTQLPNIKDELVEEIYLDTQLEHKKIREVLASIEKFLYSRDLLEYD